jgi:hypothetical protein
MQGARRVDAETYELYVAGSRKKGSAADGPFSATVTGRDAGSLSEPQASYESASPGHVPGPAA